MANDERHSLPGGGEYGFKRDGSGHWWKDNDGVGWQDATRQNPDGSVRHYNHKTKDRSVSYGWTWGSSREKDKPSDGK